MATYQLTVNGQRKEVKVDPSTPLLWVLREELKMTGTKIVTIEGIGSDPVGRVVQEAWVEKDVVQCGYCQSGQIMSACALLKANSKPSDSNIEESMGGSLCRCATYVRIRQAIKDASQRLG